MASIQREFNANVQKSEIFRAVKSCMPPSSGFNMRVNQVSVWVDDQGKSHEGIIKSYPEYGLVLAKIGPSAVAFAPCPSSKIPIHEGMAVYYAGFSEDEGTYMCHRGRISSITSNDQHFTIDGATISISSGSPVFTYDKVNRMIHLTGVITGAIGKGHDSTIRGIHINCFREDQEIKAIDELGDVRGGGRIQVGSGDFKGLEIGHGRGPRHIEINGPAQGTYDLTFINGAGIKQNPHGDANYNNDGQARLYQAALDAFVSYYNDHHAMPNQFEFVFYKQTYTATKM